MQGVKADLYQIIVCNQSWMNKPLMYVESEITDVKMQSQIKYSISWRQLKHRV